MKKILTLFLGIGAFTVSFAQSRQESKRDVFGGGSSTSNAPIPQKGGIFGGNNNNNNNGNYPVYSGSSRDQQVADVNREYDVKIQSVRTNRYLSNAEKDRAIRQLEADRTARLRDIDRSWNNNNNAYDSRNAKGNKGNHKGWEKGKGNPHRNGGKDKDRKDHDND